MRKFTILTSLALLSSALPALGQQYRYASGST
jgi:hypothetical protein